MAPLTDPLCVRKLRYASTLPGDLQYQLSLLNATCFLNSGPKRTALGSSAASNWCLEPVTMQEHGARGRGRNRGRGNRDRGRGSGRESGGLSQAFGRDSSDAPIGRGRGDSPVPPALDPTTSATAGAPAQQTRSVQANHLLNFQRYQVRHPPRSTWFRLSSGTHYKLARTELLMHARSMQGVC